MLKIKPLGSFLTFTTIKDSPFSRFPSHFSPQQPTNNMTSLTRLALLFLVCVSCILALPVDKRAGYTIKLNSGTAFCSFLPPHPGDDVGGTEENGIPFCSTSSLSSSGKVFPSGFIKSAHFVQQANYVQVTGRMDRSKYQLSSSDGGGQYDNSKWMNEK